MDYWQKAPVSRKQQVLIATMLDDRIPLDHPVRLLDEIIAGYDWTSWKDRTTMANWNNPPDRSSGVGFRDSLWIDPPDPFQSAIAVRDYP